MKSITVEAKIENVDKVTEFVNEVLEEKDCPLKVQMQLDVAIDEIFGNIAYYAYGKGSGNATIQIEMEDNPPKITLIFIDQEPLIIHWKTKIRTLHWTLKTEKLADLEFSW